ncbi:MAG: hypothetical protein LBS60_03830 [Deltaproteobacteria bacterium]|nr:hypothetical protein [Deltaproteobacteria bacterium]
MRAEPPNFKPQYVPTREKKVIADLKKLADAQKVYLATDLDREGEASLGLSKKPGN